MIEAVETIEQPKRSLGTRIAIRLVKLLLYVVFVGAAVYYTPKILSQALHTDYPMATITSGSMWPALKTNDLIFMKGVSGSEVELGQIIIYQNSRGFTIHRLVEKKDGKLITKGDANSSKDNPITEDQVIGRAVYIGDSPLRSNCQNF